MIYRLLENSEWQKLRDIVPLEYIPGPEAAAAAIAENETGKIMGVLFLELQLHIGSFILESPQVNYKRLHAVLDDAIKDRKGLIYYAMTKNPTVAKMAESVGMERVEDQVYKKEIR